MLGVAGLAHGQNLSIQNVTVRNPLLPREDLTGVTYFNGNFLAVSQQSAVLTSPDGSNWTVANITGNLVLRSIAGLANVTVAVGDAGAVVHSADGVTWTKVSPASTTKNLRRVAVSGTTFVAVGDGGTVLVSADGASWAAATSGTTANLLGINYSATNDLFVAVGANGTMVVANSTQVTGAWSAVASNTTTNLRGVAGGFGNATALNAGGDIAANTSATFRGSTDGRNWTQINALSVFNSGNINSVRAFERSFDGKAFYLAMSESGNLAETVNVNGWATTDVQGASPLQDAAINAAGDQVVVVGGNNTLFISQSDLVTWSLVDVGYYGTFRGLAIGNTGNTVLEVGNHTFLRSTNAGVTWTQKNFTDIGGNTVTMDATGAAYSAAEGAFAAVGFNGTVLTSTNLVSWTKANTGNLTQELDDVISTGVPTAHFLAVGANGVMLKASGGNWTLTGPSLTSHLRAAAYNGINSIVVAGDGGALVTTSDGANSWTKRQAGTANFRAVAYGNSTFLAVGDGGAAYSSANGSTWSAVDTGTTEPLNAVFFSGNFWVALGAAGNVYLSLDLAAWLKCTGPAPAGVGLIKGVALGTGIEFLASDGTTFTATLPDAASVPSVEISIQPVAAQAKAGQQVTFTVAGSGGDTLFYQWYRNGVKVTNGGGVSGAQSATLILNPSTLAEAGSYTVRVSNGLKYTTSEAAALAVTSAPVITTQPKSLNAAKGKTATFTVKVTGTAPLAYAWYFNTTKLKDSATVSGSAKATLILKKLTTKNSGKYKVVITNKYGKATSTQATLKVK